MVSLRHHFELEACLGHLRVVNLDDEAALGELGHDRDAGSTSSIGGVLLVAEPKDCDSGRGTAFGRAGFVLDDYICESRLLVEVEVEHALPVHCTAHHIVGVEYVDQALEVLLEAGAAEAERALQILAAYPVIGLNNGFDRGDVAARRRLAQLSHGVHRADSLGQHRIAHQLTELAAASVVRPDHLHLVGALLVTAALPALHQVVNQFKHQIVPCADDYSLRRYEVSDR